MEWISTSISVVRTGPNSHYQQQMKWRNLRIFFFFFCCFEQIQVSIGKKYEDHFISMDIGQTTCCVFLKL